MALEMASAVQTPLPLPDMSSPSSSFENLSFIISISGNFNSHTSSTKVRPTDAGDRW